MNENFIRHWCNNRKWTKHLRAFILKWSVSQVRLSLQADSQYDLEWLWADISSAGDLRWRSDSWSTFTEEQILVLDWAAGLITLQQNDWSHVTAEYRTNCRICFSSWTVWTSWIFIKLIRSFKVRSAQEHELWHYRLLTEHFNLTTDMMSFNRLWFKYCHCAAQVSSFKTQTTNSHWNKLILLETLKILELKT